MADARRLGISSTPTFLLGTVVPGSKTHVKVVKRIRGAQPFDTFQQAIKALLTALVDQHVAALR
jgi:predicted DsbA family dithiol-disulfide isomerase